MRIKAVGIDAAFANMGFAQVVLTMVEGHVDILCQDLRLVHTTADDKKVVRKSSIELSRARELHDALLQQCDGMTLAFAEVPSGSQSASAARSLGIAVGVLAACPIPLIEVSPMEVKDVITGGNRKRKVSKAEIIASCVKMWPHAPWLRLGGKPGERILNDNEHLADALVTIRAGIATPEFKRLMAINHATTSTPSFRSASHIPARRRVPLGPF